MFVVAVVVHFWGGGGGGGLFSLVRWYFSQWLLHCCSGCFCAYVECTSCRALSLLLLRCVFMLMHIWHASCL